LKLTLDTSQVAFTVGSEPEPVIDFQTKLHRTDDQGRPIFGVQLIATFKDDKSGKVKSEILNVKIAGTLTPLPIGSPVRVAEMTAFPWVNNDRSGIAYRAAAIEPIKPTPAPRTS